MDVGSRGVSIHSKNYWQECVQVGFLATSLYFFSNAVLVIDEESTVFTATQVLATPSHPGSTLLLFQWLLFVQQLQIVC